MGVVNGTMSGAASGGEVIDVSAFMFVMQNIVERSGTNTVVSQEK